MRKGKKKESKYVRGGGRGGIGIGFEDEIKFVQQIQ